MSKHVAVLMGGLSNERPVSLSSGHECAKALRNAGYTVTEIDVGYDIAERAARAEAGRRVQRAAWPLRRGWHDPGRARVPAHSLYPFGRAGLGAGDGQAPGQDHAQGRRHSGHRSRHRRPRRGRRAPMSWHRPMWSSRSPTARASASSSSRPTSRIRRRKFCGEDWKGGEELMVERYIPGRELTCAVMGDVALGVTEIVTDLAFYNYEAKYTDGGSRHIIPAQIATENLRQSAEDGAQGACCAWVPGRYADRLPLQRPGRRGRRTRLPRDQHPARHDPDFTGSRAGAPCGPSLRGAGHLDGGGRELQQVGAKGFADAQLVDPAPAPCSDLRVLAPARGSISATPGYCTASSCCALAAAGIVAGRQSLRAYEAREMSSSPAR